MAIPISIAALTRYAFCNLIFEFKIAAPSSASRHSFRTSDNGSVQGSMVITHLDRRYLVVLGACLTQFTIVGLLSRWVITIEP